MNFATWTDSDLRAVCRRNDPNGDWTDASRGYMVETIARWLAEEPDSMRWVMFHALDDSMGGA